MSVYPAQPSSKDPAYLSQTYPSQFSTPGSQPPPPPTVYQPQPAGDQPPPQGYHTHTTTVIVQDRGRAYCKECGGDLIGQATPLGCLLCLLVPFGGFLFCMLTMEFKCRNCGKEYDNKHQEIRR